MARGGRVAAGCCLVCTSSTRAVKFQLHQGFWLYCPSLAFQCYKQCEDELVENPLYHKTTLIVVYVQNRSMKLSEHRALVLHHVSEQCFHLKCSFARAVTFTYLNCMWQKDTMPAELQPRHCFWKRHNFFIVPLHINLRSFLCMFAMSRNSSTLLVLGIDDY